MFLPQPYTAPAVVKPKVRSLPPSIDAQVCPPLTSTCVVLFEVVPLPSAPYGFLPQQYPAPAAVTSQVWSQPGLTAVASPLEIETETVDVPLNEPDVAVIVADPFATAVTRPADDTVATPVFDEDHVTVAPEIAVPPASLTVAASVVVPPLDMRVTVLGDTVTLDAT